MRILLWYWYRYRPIISLLRVQLGASFRTVQRLPHQADAFRFLFFGRLRAYKGLDLLRDDAAKLLQALRQSGLGCTVA